MLNVVTERLGGWGRGDWKLDFSEDQAVRSGLKFGS